MQNLLGRVGLDDQEQAVPRLLRCLCSSLFMRQCCQLPCLIKHGARPWVQTSVSGNRLLMKKKHRLLCRKSVFLTFALHPSLSPCESGFSSTPRLNFLSALGECQSKSGSPARKPPQQLGRWLPPSAPLLPFCQAGDFCRIDWLSALCTSGSAHRKWNRPGYVRQAGCHMSSPVIFVPNEQGCRLKPPFYCYLLNTSVTVVSSVSSSAFNCAGDVF